MEKIHSRNSKKSMGGIRSVMLLCCLMATMLLSLSELRAADTKPRVQITGVVTDTGGLPVPGASVVLHGTTIGISTDTNGKFKLEFDERPNIIIDVSFIGMKKQEIPVTPRGGKANLKVVLENDTEIEEVVVTGIFNRKKEGYTGSVNTIKGEDIKKYSTTNIAKAISAMEPSFRVMENFEMGSDPNALPDMRMRGTSTLPGGSTGDGLVSLQGEYDTYPNQPLLLLDGFEIDVQTMADLDPDRVASITILKDASATAIYGSKASNGVIVIETLAPKPGAINVTYSGNVRVEMPDLSSYNLMNSAEKIYVEKLAGLYAENDLASQRDYQSRLREVKRGVDTYWLSQPLRTSVQQRHAVTLEGGSNELRYKLYAGLNETPGVMKGSKRSTQTASLDLSYRFKKFLLKNSITADNAVGNESPYGSFSEYAQLNPYLRPYDENGNINKVMQTWNMLYSGNGNSYEVANPLYNTTFHSLNRTTDFTVRELFKLEYRPTEEWILQGNVSLSKNNGKAEVFRPGYHTAFKDVTDPALKGDFTRTQSESFNYAVDFTVMYNKNIRNTHYITANLRYSVEQTSDEAYGAKVTGFPNDQMDHILFGKKYDENMTGSENTSRSIGGVLALGYSYKYRYSIDANIRMDGSSQFGKDNRFAPFWSAGFKWNVTNEEFMKKANKKWLDDLVFAMSYGITGNQGFAPYQSRQVYSYSNLMRYYLSSDATGIELVALGNDHLKWQQTATWNTRIELSAFKGRLTARAEYYIKNTKNSLAQITLAPSLGFASYPENMGTLENKGVELNLAVIPYRNEATQSYWVVSVNGSHNKNKLKKISQALQHQNEINASAESISPLPRYVEGQSTTGIWAVRSLGIDPATGDEILLKRDGSITSVYDAVDAVLCGDTEPKWQGTINTSFQYKGFGANLAFSYRFGGQMYNETLVSKVENADLRYNADRRVLTERWQNPGDLAQYKRLTNSSSGSNTMQTSRFVMDENTLQMGSFSLTYRMDRNNTPFLSKLKISSMKWGFTMEDVFYASSIKRERGTIYPFSRQFALSLNIVF